MAQGLTDVLLGCPATVLSALPTASAPTPPPNSWSQPEETPTACAPKHASRPCAVPCPTPAAGPTATASRGGGLGADAALYLIALYRTPSDARTRDYVTRQTAAGRTKKEIIRLLPRAIARGIFRYLTTPATVPDVSDLRPARRAKNFTLTTVAEHFGDGGRR